MQTIAFKGGAFDPPQISHLRIAEQISTDNIADRIHIGPSGVRPDKSYHVASTHRRRMLQIMLEERPDLRDIVVPDFDFIDAPREKSATHGVDAWFRERYQTIPRQIFGTDVIPNIDRFWMHPEWVKKTASKLFVPRGSEEVDFTGMKNYLVMPFRGNDFQKGLASSQIRARIPEGDFRGLSLGVAEYINKNGLYLPEKNPATISLHVGKRVDGILTHVKARTQIYAGYPERFPVPDDAVSWDIQSPSYCPTEHTDQLIFAQFRDKGGNGWADPEDLYIKPDTVFRSYTGFIRGDEEGRPLNPHGRTGITGRGILGNWGPNFAADPLVTRRNPETGQMELLVILREDSLEWAIPGGMVDYGEYGSATARRELMEEAGLDIDFSQAPIIYQGYVDDPRNTDNAWMETTAVHIHLDDEQAKHVRPKAGSDAKKVRWMPLVDPEIDTLYASHSRLVRDMLSKFHNPETMQTLLHIVTAPEIIPESLLPKVFLAGSIEQDRASDWQKQLLAKLQRTPCMILNPRRAVWDPTWSQEDNPQLTEQIRWELDGIEKADMVCFYFDPNTKSPITLLELGFVRNKKNVHICCPPGYWRRANVLETGKRLGYVFHETMEEMIGAIKRNTGEKS